MKLYTIEHPSIRVSTVVSILSTSIIAVSDLRENFATTEVVTVIMA